MTISIMQLTVIVGMLEMGLAGTFVKYIGSQLNTLLSVLIFVYK